MRIVIFTRSVWGLGQDAKIIEQALRELNVGGAQRIDSIDHIDPITFYGSGRRPRSVDIQIHLEVPCRAAWRWARYNIVMVNPEWWVKGAWDWACAPPSGGGADLFIFKSQHARALFPEVDDTRCRIVPWRCSPEISGALSHLEKGSPPIREFLYLIGASANKLLAAKKLCAVWRATWPKLHVVATESVLIQLRTAVPDCAAHGVVLKEPYPTDSGRIAAQANFAYHVVASAAEGFGFTFAEAAAVGALPLWTDLPVYKEHWGSIVGTTGLIPSSHASVADKYKDAVIGDWDEKDIVACVESLLKLDDAEEKRLRGALRHAYTVRIKEFRHAWRAIMGVVTAKLRGVPLVPLPPKLPAVQDLPHVAIITVTRNRPRWFANMARNVLLSDYPPDKMTWIVADDGDTGRVDSSVAKFQTDNPRIAVKYLSFPKQLHIGAKRNRACEAAPAEASVFVMMDDDDHYPKNSILARVAWLRGTGVGCIYSSVLPMYDCGRYISAINVPPLILDPRNVYPRQPFVLHVNSGMRGNFLGPCL